MAQYTFKCAEHYQTTEIEAPMGTQVTAPRCPSCGSAMRRDYKVDAPAMAVAGLKHERENGDVLERTFLPHADDFKSKDDPEGTKGLREWNRTHDPKPGNKRPKRPGGREIKESF